MKYLALLALSAASMLAEVSGVWTGSMIIANPNGENQNGPARLVLKQDGATVTGTAGPDENEQHAISNGKFAGGKLTFELEAGGGTMKFTLTQDGDSIKGDITREREGQKQTAKLAVTRGK